MSKDNKITFTLEDFDKAVEKEIQRICEDEEIGTLQTFEVVTTGTTFAVNVRRHLQDMKGDE